MKEFKGTKGEWTMWCEENVFAVVSPDSNGTVAAVYDGWEDVRNFNVEAAKANAHLIAAAPELLWALQNVVKGYKHLVDGEFGNVDWSNEYEVIERGHDEIIDAEKAINKALGL